MVYTVDPNGDPRFFNRGRYSVILFGSQDNPSRDTIRDVGGKRLDGEPVNNWQSGPFSGDGQEGGNFIFKFEIQ
jgi:hypothetical protein